MLPIPLSDASPEWCIPTNVAKQIIGFKYFIVENIRTTRRYLKRLDKSIDIDALEFFVLDKRTKRRELQDFIEPAIKGHDIGLMSEAGMPGIADPGADIAKIAHAHGLQVVPYAGPSSIMLALSASGLNGQNFTFNGYLPANPQERVKKLTELDAHSVKENVTHIFIETPYRNQHLFDSILSTCSSNTMVCVACDITDESEFIRTLAVKDWKRMKKPNLHKRPAVFLIHRSR